MKINHAPYREKCIQFIHWETNINNTIAAKEINATICTLTKGKKRG